MTHRSFAELIKEEFSGYNAAKFRQDVMAGLTVAAVALPLALAFGVASGATAAAGLVTAILSGLIIGGLSGAPYQISGPTGAMSAVLIVLAEKYGLSGIWIAGALAGILLLVIDIVRLGRFIAFVPAPVIAGFTTGIALIIAIGQIDNLFGIKTAQTHSAALKLFGYLHADFTPDWRAFALGRARDLHDGVLAASLERAVSRLVDGNLHCDRNEHAFRLVRTRDRRDSTNASAR
jgi:SulP family sulfate permease